MKLRMSCAAAAVLTVLAGPAAAADLGGNCCADLEERIAELEATTVRKGNRKVKLEVSGQVNESILIWDDGGSANSESGNAYVGTNDTARSRFRFRGEAKIADDWKAGYLLEIGVRTNRLSRTDQDVDDGPPGTDSGLDLRHSAWWIENKHAGRLWVGRTSQAADGVTEVTTANLNHFARMSASKWNMGNQLIIDGVRSDRRWRDILPADGFTGDNVPGEGDRSDLVKWVSPKLHGFEVSASWGEDDFWDVALRYSGEMGGFKLAAAAGYGQWTDDNFRADLLDSNNNAQNESLRGCASADPNPRTSGTNDPGVPGAGSDNDCESFGMSASVMHEDSGIFLNLAYGIKHDNLREAMFRNRRPGTAFQNFDDEDWFWGVQAGIEKKFIEHGKTTLYGEFAHFETGAQIGDVFGDVRSFNNVAFPGLGAGNHSFSIGSEVQYWGIGINQHFEKAALDIYLAYRHYEGQLTIGDFRSGETAKVDVQDMDQVMTGAMIKF